MTTAFPLSEVEPKPVGSRFSIDERRARGKAARAEIPRSAHGAWEPASVRRDPVELLEEQARARLPELVPIRYGRMLVSPFTFFRGAAYVMAADLANGARTGLHTQLCGDAHLSNFGFFAAPDRRLVFSINDFDETLPGPFEWDVKRLAASFTVAARDLGFDEGTRRSVVLTTARAYRDAMARFAVMRHIDVWYTRLDADRIVQGFSVKITTRAKRRLEADLAKARTKDSVRALAKLCRTVGGELRIIGNPPLITPIEDVLPGAEQADLDGVIRRMIDTYAESLPPIGVSFSSAIGTFMRRGRWWVSEASAPAPGSCFCLDVTTATRCSCSSRRRRLRCSNPSWARAGLSSTASGSLPASG